MFSSYVLYDTVAIEAVYFPHNFTSADAHTRSSNNSNNNNTDASPSSNDPDAAYELTIRDILLHRLTERYVGRIIPSRGLCVAITEVMEYSASSVRGAAASAWLTATFGICVFAPAPGTRLKARIAHQTTAGIYLTLDLFVSIPFLVPAAMLVPGSRYHAAQRSWYLPLDGAEGDEEEKSRNDGAAPAAAAATTGASSSYEGSGKERDVGGDVLTIPHNKYIVGAEVIVKVVSCTVLSEEAAVAAEAEAAEGASNIANTANLVGSSASVLSLATLPSIGAGSDVNGFGTFGEGPLSLMELRGSFVGDALGPVSWFEDA